MSSLRKRNGVWYADLYVRGCRVKKSLRTGDKDLARRKLIYLEQELLHPEIEFSRSDDIRFSEAAERWREWALSHLRERSIQRVVESANIFLKVNGDCLLSDITVDKCEAFKLNRLKFGNAKETVNGRLKDLTTIFNRAISQGWYFGVNPLKNVERFRIPWTEPEFHTDKERNRLFRVAQSYPRYLQWTILLGAWAGLRKMEISFARWEWFHFDKDEPRIAVRAHSEFNVKDHEDRSIPMHALIYHEMIHHRKESGYIFDSFEWNNGNSRYRFECRKMLISCLEKTELTTRSPYHRLRDTFGSICVQKGISIKKVSRWLGHSSVIVTERNYVGLQSYDEEINKI